MFLVKLKLIFDWFIYFVVSFVVLLLYSCDSVTSTPPPSPLPFSRISSLFIPPPFTPFFYGHPLHPLDFEVS